MASNFLLSKKNRRIDLIPHYVSGCPLSHCQAGCKRVGTGQRVALHARAWRVHIGNSMPLIHEILVGIKTVTFTFWKLLLKALPK